MRFQTKPLIPHPGVDTCIPKYSSGTNLSSSTQRRGGAHVGGGVLPPSLSAVWRPYPCAPSHHHYDAAKGSISRTGTDIGYQSVHVSGYRPAESEAAQWILSCGLSLRWDGEVTVCTLRLCTDYAAALFPFAGPFPLRWDPNGQVQGRHGWGRDPTC